MPQFYLLSVISTVVAGLALSSDYLGKKSDFFASFDYLRKSRSIQIATGLITAIIGVLKLFFRFPKDQVFFLADFVPAVVGIILGIILIGEAFRQHPKTEGEPEKVGKSVEKVAEAIMPYRVPVGIAGAVVGLVHFLFPRILFL